MAYSFRFTEEFRKLTNYLESEGIVGDIAEVIGRELNEAEMTAEMKAAIVKLDEFSKENNLEFSREAILWGIMTYTNLDEEEVITEEELDDYCIENLDDEGVLVVEEADTTIDVVDAVLNARKDLLAEGYFPEALDEREVEQLTEYIDSNFDTDYNSELVSTIRELVHDATAYKNLKYHPYARCYSGLALSDRETIDSEENNNPDDWYEEVVSLTNSDLVIAYHHC